MQRTSQPTHQRLSLSEALLLHHSQRRSSIILSVVHGLARFEDMTSYAKVTFIPVLHEANQTEAPIFTGRLEAVRMSIVLPTVK